MRRTAPALTLIACLTGAAWTAGTACAGGGASTPLPRYLIAVWDGENTGPGLWFAAEGIALAPDVTLSPVTVLPVGTVIGAEAGRLTVSSAMAFQFGMKPGEPILVEVLARSEASNRPDTSPEEQPPATTAAARRDRIKSLLGELRDAAAAERQAFEGAIE